MNPNFEIIAAQISINWVQLDCIVSNPNSSWVGGGGGDFWEYYLGTAYSFDFEFEQQFSGWFVVNALRGCIDLGHIYHSSWGYCRMSKQVVESLKNGSTRTQCRKKIRTFTRRVLT